MGAYDGQSDEQPVHWVTVPSFDMLKTEVTVSQYGDCVAAGACTEPGDGSTRNWGDLGYEDHPVNYVTWQQAADYCGWAGGRLPSEAEWEYAARSQGQDIDYPWGSAAPTCQYAVVMEETSRGCGTERTWPVCSKQAGNSAQGLCDMVGNVSEWVQDWYQTSHSGAPTDGSPWEWSAAERCKRGGDLGYSSTLQVTNRSSDDPAVPRGRNGVRCARTAF
jgi:formylglycine-generating enzyme required for sulfatase activity